MKTQRIIWVVPAVVLGVCLAGGCGDNGTKVPTITITSPASGATVSTDFSVTFTVLSHTVAVGGDHIHFSIDSGADQEHDSTAAFSVTGLSVGSHTISATLVDASHVALTNAAATTSVTFTVSTTGPSVTINAPTDGSTIGTTPLISFTISNWTVGFGNTHFKRYVDGTEIGPWYNTNPFFIENLAVGSRTITLKLVDAAGVPTGVEDSVTVTVAADAGLATTVANVKTFLGGKGGILIWVDNTDAKKLKYVDFSAASPSIQTLPADVNCVNPRLSPDGTRVIYTTGTNINSDRPIKIRSLSGGAATLVDNGDHAYWYTDSSGNEWVVWCDFSPKNDNGSTGKTYMQPVQTGTTTLTGAKTELYANRAMDGGPNGGTSITNIWLAQVYDQLYAYNVATSTEYGPTQFFLMEGTDLTGEQTCNGSMAPDSSSRLMELVIPHDWVRIFEYKSATSNFQEVSRFQLPAGLKEWEYPEWSTDSGFATAALRASDLTFRIHLVKIATGDLTPQVLQVVPTGSSYSHLYVAP